MDKLYIIIPAYNEEDNIASVAREWHTVVAKINSQSRLVIIDDGSKDNTYNILKTLETNLPQLIGITKPNNGHGATILYGYNYALEQGADFIFQTDSDRQTVAADFWQFWPQRNNFSVLLGHRNQRQDGWSRILITKILRLVLNCIFGLNITDANVPFRLLQRKVLQKYLPKIPRDFYLANVILTVYLVKHKENIKYIPITFKPRGGGASFVNYKSIFKIGRRAVKDFWEVKKEL
ncbi:MAG: glycosyltransferase family 2 protein [Candidatus Margulisbacteria bacterium]|jgi:glycosyltransferase involved in cell wall biosynthesis|nr:glycosyltransferase family 2 protein [Candidatus Margulisiibacteriota bacterium]